MRDERVCCPEPEGMFEPRALTLWVELGARGALVGVALIATEDTKQSRIFQGGFNSVAVQVDEDSDLEYRELMTRRG